MVKTKATLDRFQRNLLRHFPTVNPNNFSGSYLLNYNDGLKLNNPRFPHTQMMADYDSPFHLKPS